MPLFANRIREGSVRSRALPDRVFQVDRTLQFSKCATPPIGSCVDLPRSSSKADYCLRMHMRIPAGVCVKQPLCELIKTFFLLFFFTTNNNKRRVSAASSSCRASLHQAQIPAIAEETGAIYEGFSHVGVATGYSRRHLTRLIEGVFR